MDIYKIELTDTDKIYNRIFYALKMLTKEYNRREVIGYNFINFPQKFIDDYCLNLQNDMINFVFINTPPCVFSYISKYKMCDFSVNLELKNNNIFLILFSGSGYPVSSYQRNIFLNYYRNFKIIESGKTSGKILFIKDYNAVNKYIKDLFTSNKKHISYIKNFCNNYYFKVKNKYYVLDADWSHILNLNSKSLIEKLTKYHNNRVYNNALDDTEFDCYLYMLSRKIPCIKLIDGSIMFADSYYIDYLKLIYFLEFLC